MADAFEAQFTSFKFLKTAGEYAIELRVPRHKWAEVYALLGDPPDAGQSTWVGVARLVGPADA
jgi:hypothetical protein